MPGSNDGWQLAKYSVGDACSINFQPDAAGVSIAIAGVISGIGWQITPAAATMTVELEDGDQTVYFILDSAEFGILDVNRLG